MRSSLGILSLSGLIFLALPVDATVLMHMSVKEMTHKAAHVVQGKVVFQAVVEQDDTIYTDSHVKVSSAIKGRARVGHVFIVRQLGGETRTRGVHVSGTARFKLGEQVLVFLSPAGKQRYKPVGMCLGKYRLSTDSRGRRWASRDLSGAAIARHDKRARVVINRQHLRGHWDLLPTTKLLSHVRAQLKGGVR